ncbi:MAG: hypothetical protein JNJ45_03920 [Chthonomonas sp.]|nr:hypothetical protein [Chthonomonas sp.]
MMKKFVLMSLVVMAAGGFAQEDPRPERNAEATLATILKTYQEVKSFHVTVWVGNRAASDLPFLYSGSQELWYGGGNKFRFETIGHFGNGIRAVSDGTKYMYDPQTETPQTRIAIGKAKPAVADMDSTFALGRTSGNPLLAFLGKVDLMGKAIPADTFIVAGPKEDGLESVSFGTLGAGVMNIYFDPADPMKLARRVEWDNEMAWRTAMNKAGKGSAPIGGRIYRFDFFYRSVNKPLAANTFDATPPKGYATINIDERGDGRRIRMNEGPDTSGVTRPAKGEQSQ